MYRRKKLKTGSSVIELLGWMGVIMGLVAYTLVVFRIVDASNNWYLILNIIGSFFLVFEAAKKLDWQSVVVHSVVGGFALINFVALFFIR